MVNIEELVFTLPEHLQERFYERSGIKMDSGMSKHEADEQAWTELLEEVRNEKTQALR